MSSSGKVIMDSALRAAAHVRSSTLPKEVSKSASSMLSSAASGTKHVLPDLPYDYNALERKIIFSCFGSFDSFVVSSSRF